MGVWVLVYLACAGGFWCLRSLALWVLTDIYFTAPPPSSGYIYLPRPRPQGIAFLHSVGLVHADIKPENVALYPPSTPASTPPTTPDSSSRGGATLPPAVRARVGGAAGDQSPSPPFDLRLIDLGNSVFAADAAPGVTAGTPSYLSPEARKGLPWGPKVDVWAVGCVLYEIVTGGRVGVVGEAFGEGDGLMVLLVKRLLAEEVDTRPTAEEALKDPVFL